MILTTSTWVKDKAKIDKRTQRVLNKKSKHQASTYWKMAVDQYGHSNLVALNIEDHISSTATLQMEYFLSNNQIIIQKIILARPSYNNIIKFCTVGKLCSISNK